MAKQIFKILLIATVLFTSLGFTTLSAKSPFVKVVKDLRESVVNIRVEADIKANIQSSPFMQDDIFRRFFRVPQMPNRKSVSMGSGFVFKKDKQEVYILTNNHVVDSAEDGGTITVTLADKAEYEAEIVGLDSFTDLAVIKIVVDKKEKVVVADFGDSDKLEVGQWVIAIGNPFGQLGLERTVTVGVVSAKGRANLNFGADSPVFQDYIQTDAAINPGNSGGPLLDIEGKVIGVNAAITSPAGGNVGIGFAIPANIAKKVSSDLIAKGKVIRAYLGMLPQEIDANLAQSLGLENVKGVLVAKVEDDTPAAKAGLKKGDVIIEFDQKEVENAAKFRVLVAQTNVGKKVKIKIQRGDKTKILTAKLEEYPESSIAGGTFNNKSLGFKVSNIDDSKLKNNYAEQGVIVTSVTPGSKAQRAGISPGDVIAEINRTQISNVKDFNKAIKKAKKSKRKLVMFYIISVRGGYKYLTLGL